VNPISPILTVSLTLDALGACLFLISENRRCFTVADLLFPIRVFEEQNDPSDREVLW
jgi:hypothetical protein